MKKDVFSPMEKQVLEVIGRKKIRIMEIADLIYEDWGPISPNNSVASVISRINKKCKYYKLTWFVDGKGAGRGGRTVWVTKY